MKAIGFVTSIFFALLLLSSCKKNDTSKFGVEKQFEILSSHTQTSYTVSVFYPDDQFPSSSVPVIYLLDGFWYKKMVAEIIREMSDNASMPKSILVSIDYTKGDGIYERSKDLKYPGVGIDTPSKGPAFYKFLTEELAPNVDANYKTDTANRVLIGHSLGGFFSLFSLMDNPNRVYFQKRIAASSSIGLGIDNLLFEKELQLVSTTTNLPAKVYIGCGTFVGSAPAMHLEFEKRIKSRGYNGLQTKVELVPKSHGTDPYPLFKSGLLFLFSN